MPLLASASSTASAIAFNCRFEVPEASKKKSVKLASPLKSNTTRSAAFFSWDALTATRSSFPMLRSVSFFCVNPLPGP